MKDFRQEIKRGLKQPWKRLGIVRASKTGQNLNLLKEKEGISRETMPASMYWYQSTLYNHRVAAYRGYVFPGKVKFDYKGDLKETENLGFSETGNLYFRCFYSGELHHDYILESCNTLQEDNGWNKNLILIKKVILLSNLKSRALKITLLLCIFIIYFQFVFGQLFEGYPCCLFLRVLLTDTAHILSLDSSPYTFMSGKECWKTKTLIL